MNIVKWNVVKELSASSRFDRAGVLEPVRAALRRWLSIDLITQLALGAAFATLAGMVVFGSWVAERMERGVVEHAAVNAALHLDSFVEPHLQSLHNGGELSEAARQALLGLSDKGRQGHVISAIRIWRPEGSVAFSSVPGDGAAAPAMMPEIQKALNGSVQTQFERSGSWWPWNGIERGAVLKLYAPMHHPPAMTVIAVAEVHQDASDLASSLAEARFETGAFLALLSLIMSGSMFTIVRKSGSLLAEHRRALSARVKELSAALDENNELQRRILDGNRRSAETNDRILRRISAELHDGPVQLIALALLRLEGVRSDEKPGTPDAAGNDNDDVQAIESALRDALKEIRGMSSGLSLPKLEGASVRQAVEYAVMNHESRSRTRVKLHIGEELPKVASPVFLTCLYRFVQEALNNAFRHAGGKDQSVKVLAEGGFLIVEVADGGPGFISDAVPPAGDGTKGLGLIGLKDRISALGGELDIASNAGAGTRLKARFSLGNTDGIAL